jgi:Ni/Co efflux regulator RcnB
MLLALLALALVTVVLAAPIAYRRATAWRLERARRRPAHAGGLDLTLYDPGRERRAEQRARELLKSCVNEEEWAMYRDLGFIRVWGGQTGLPADTSRDLRGVPYAYLIYPHKPIVAYLPQTRELLNEYCVAFPDETRPYGSARLPDSDDVLAKWMALTGDERRLIATANMHLPGRQVDPKQVRRDLWRLSQWERDRLRRAQRPEGSVPAP